MLPRGCKIGLAGYVALILTLTAGLSAQQDTANPFYNQLKQPWQLYQAGKLDEAAAGFRAVLEKATAAQDHLAQAWAQDALGTIFYDKAEYPAARAAFERALGFYQAVPSESGEAIAIDQLGTVVLAMGDDALAREYFRKALSTFERLGMRRYQAIVMGRLSHANDPDGAQLDQRAFQIARELGDTRLQADILHRQGDGLFMHGVFDAAEERYQQSAALYQKSGSKMGLARVLTSQGRLQRVHGHAEKALEFYAGALKIQQEIHDGEGSIQSINAMAVARQELGEKLKAVALYQQALAMAKETGSQKYINFELANLAGAYSGLGRHREAIDILEKLLRENPAMEWADLRYLTLAMAYYQLGRYPESIQTVSKGIEMMRSSKHPGPLPDALLWRAYGEDKAGDSAAALSDAQASLKAIEELRVRLVPSDFMKRGFAERTQRTFSLTIRLLTAAHQPDRALEVAEEARARAFLDLLAARSSPAAVAPVTDEPFEEAADSGLRTETSALWRQWTSVDTELPSPVSAQPVSFAGVQAIARRLDSTVLSYWVSDDSLFAWVVSPAGEVHSAVSVVSRVQLEKLVGALWPRGDAALAPNAGNRNNWRELYRLLIEPVEKWLPERSGSLLTIEPNGPLLRLPFAALRNQQGRYLLERFTLHYVPAISLLEFTQEKSVQAAAAPRSVLLIADPSSVPAGPDGKTLPALPGARREALAVAKLLPISQVTVLEGKQATEQRVRQVAGQNTVIHFATHGIIRDDRPFDSFLALGSSGSGKEQDGRFTAQEIYGLQLKVDLVFLSACRSGLGQVTGDGMVGLTRAFLYAGAPSVIASLWDVADEPTYRLIPAFYRVWLQGKSKASALRAAQLELLRALRAGQIKVHTAAGDMVLPEDPVFWASFVLQGEA